MSGRGWILALLAGLLPGTASAEVLLLRNETQAPVVVQAAAVVGGVLQRGRPMLVLPGDVTPPIVVAGNKIITIYDAKMPNRVVGQGVVPAGPTDQLFGIVLDGPTRVRIQPRQLPRR
jgi:hypothetical protein